MWSLSPARSASATRAIMRASPAVDDRPAGRDRPHAVIRSAAGTSLRSRKPAAPAAIAASTCLVAVVVDLIRVSKPNRTVIALFHTWSRVTPTLNFVRSGPT